MKKIPYSEFVKSITMLFINDQIDEKYEKLKMEKVVLLQKQMSGINTIEGLKKYIVEDEDSLKNILILLGISTEYFKRVISMFRIKRGMEFQTEWSIEGTRRYMLSDQLMMDKVCNLFLEGDKKEEYYSCIPKYRLSNFVINEAVMARLGNNDFMRFLVSKDFDTNYNSDVSMSNVAIVEETLNNTCKDKGYYICKNENVDPIGNNTREIVVNYTIKTTFDKKTKYYIKYSFILTTSKGQSDFKRSVKDLRDYIKSNSEELKQIVIVDGAGWIGRQSDLRDIWDYSDYCINLNHLSDLNEIIK